MQKRSLFTTLTSFVLLMPLAVAPLAGCDPAVEYDEALLAEYKRALPKKNVLEAPQAGAGAANLAVGDAAEYPQLASPIVNGINQHVRGIVDTLDAVTDLPPTVYNSETKEFLWGPWENSDSGVEGENVLVYIRDAGEDEDFRYHYAFLRGIGNDLSTFDPVIWGGANPDADNPEEYGAGITLYDFEANAAWEDEHHPNHGAVPRGRFVTVYKVGPDEESPEKINTIVLASFRNFVTEEEPDATPANLDHLYGRVTDGDTHMDFVSIEAEIDLQPEDDLDGIPEFLTIDAVAVNSGIGRGEVSVSGGTLDTEGQNISLLLGTECWDDLVARTYFDLTATMDNDDDVSFVTEGAPEDCGAMNATLADLGVPSLDTVPADLRAALAEIAENGVPADDGAAENDDAAGE